MTDTYEQRKTAHAAELDAMIGRIERGEEETYGPFGTIEANRNFLISIM